MRATATANPAGGNDPLAELARLIGQSDPFAEFGRDNTPPRGAQRAAANWPAPPTAPARRSARRRQRLCRQSGAAGAPPTQGFGAPNYQQPGYDAFAFNSGAGLYRTGTERRRYAGAPVQGEGYAGDAFYQEAQSAEDEDVYDDMPPPRRRIGVVAIAAVFALAVVGTAGAFGYRALFGSSGTHAPPPVIKADNAPIKVVPSAREQGSAVEQDDHRPRRRPPGRENGVARRNSRSTTRRHADGCRGRSRKSSPLAPANGSGVVTSEPKKIHTITIRPEQVGMADTGAFGADAVAGLRAGPGAGRRRAREIPPPPPAPRPAPPPQRAANVPPVVAADQSGAGSAEPRPARLPGSAASACSARPRSNAPLSLNPDAAPARASAPSRPAARRPSAGTPLLPTGSGGGYAVQVSAQRSEAEAQAAFRSMQAKYPNQLGNREPIIRRVDLGEKGIYFRAMVGPFASGSEASEVCSSLKSAGGQCIVQKI